MSYGVRARAYATDKHSYDIYRAVKEEREQKKKTNLFARRTGSNPVSAFRRPQLFGFDSVRFRWRVTRRASAFFEFGPRFQFRYVSCSKLSISAIGRTGRCGGNEQIQIQIDPPVGVQRINSVSLVWAELKPSVGHGEDFRGFLWQKKNRIVRVF